MHIQVKEALLSIIPEKAAQWPQLSRGGPSWQCTYTATEQPFQGEPERTLKECPVSVGGMIATPVWRDYNGKGRNHHSCKWRMFFLYQSSPLSSCPLMEMVRLETLFNEDKLFEMTLNYIQANQGIIPLISVPWTAYLAVSHWKRCPCSKSKLV